jgi:hypothetical protein
MIVEDKPALQYSLPVADAEPRLRELILYFARALPRLTGTRLNALLFAADFETFVAEGRPLTGLPYIRYIDGPILQAYMAVRDRLTTEGSIRIQEEQEGGRVRRYVVPLREAHLDAFTPKEHRIMEEMLAAARACAPLPHAHAWRIATCGEPIPYERAYVPAPARPSATVRAALEETLRRRR